MVVQAIRVEEGLDQLIYVSASDIHWRVGRVIFRRSAEVRLMRYMIAGQNFCDDRVEECCCEMEEEEVLRRVRSWLVRPRGPDCCGTRPRTGLAIEYRGRFPYRRTIAHNHTTLPGSNRSDVTVQDVRSMTRGSRARNKNVSGRTVVAEDQSPMLEAKLPCCGHEAMKEYVCWRVVGFVEESRAACGCA